MLACELIVTRRGHVYEYEPEVGGGNRPMFYEPCNLAFVSGLCHDYGVYGVDHVALGLLL